MELGKSDSSAGLVDFVAIWKAFQLITGKAGDCSWQRSSRLRGK